MVRMQKLLMLVVLGSTVALLAGCGTATMAKPRLGFGELNMDANLEREDLEIMERVEGTSSTSTYLFGLVKIIDGDLWQVMGIKLFKDRYTPHPTYTSPFWATTADRAYYKALAQQREADAVFVRSWDMEESGCPWLCHTRQVTVSGKAVRLKTDATAPMTRTTTMPER